MGLSLARDQEDLAFAARALLTRCRITGPEGIHLRKIAASLNLSVEAVPADGFAGVLLRMEDAGTILVDQKMGEARQRFTIAHEIGHASLHPQTDPRHTCGLNDVREFSIAAKPREREANVFASELLMPADMFRTLISYPPSMENIRHLAETFRTSLSSSAIRYCSFTGERCAIVFSKDNEIKWAAPSADFGYEVLRFGYLDPETYAADAFSGKVLREGMRTAPLEAWVEDEVPVRAVVHEDSLAMPRLDAVLTLLWIEGADEDEEGDCY